MNLQRREEISALLAAPVTGGAGQVLEYRDALMECRAHIDALEQTAAERVIRDGSRGPTPDYTGEGSAWVPPAVAPAVVVPEVPMGTALQRLGLRLTQILDGHEFAVLEHEFLNPAIEEMQKLSVLSDRALGEGMGAVKWISVNDALPEDGQTVGFVTECANDKWYHGRVLGGRYMVGEFGGFSVPGLMVQASHWFAFPPLPDTLRANQGGAAA